MKLPVAIVLGATITTSAAAFAFTRGSAVSRSSSLISNVRNSMGYSQRKSSTSMNASPMDYAKSEIASSDVSCIDLYFGVLSCLHVP